MSGSGSISRKRVGSLNQRGTDSPLPPLDIQSIQMPLNPQNALALKTAALSSTKSLYQTCSTLRKRLRCVEDFTPFLDQPPGAEPLDVVSQMCHTFRLGSPLCHLYNLLIPSFIDPSSSLFAHQPLPKQIEYDFPAFAFSPHGVRNWAKRPENAKTCQKYIAMFCMAMKQRQSEGRWHGDIWALHELWGKSTGEDMEAYDSTGLMKVLRTVEAILDYLPEAAMTTLSPTTPYSSSSHHFSAIGPSRSHQSRMSFDLPFSMGGTGPGATAVGDMAMMMNGGVHIESDTVSPLSEEIPRAPFKSSADANAFKSVEELVSSEKSYVQELEILVRCSTEMVEVQLVSTETNHKVFSNLSKILDFHRKFLIKLETEYEPIQEGRGPKAWAEGRWGRPFCSSEAEFNCYGPYCANYLEAMKVVNDQMPNLMRGQDLLESQRPCLHPERELQAFMIKPIQRITKYGLLLDAILHATAKHDYPYRGELEEGYAAVKRIAANINEVTDFKAKQATVLELIDRVEDWKGHEVEKFGDLWLDDHFTVTKADQPREYHVFLFEKMMLCCKEVMPERKDKKSAKSSSMLRKDKTASKSMLPEKRRLALKGRIFVSNINKAMLLPPDPNEPYTPPRLLIAWTIPHRQPNGWHEDLEDSFVVIGKSEDQMKKWADKVMELSATERKKQADYRAERTRLNERYSGPDRMYPMSTFAPPTPASEHPPYGLPPPGSMYPQSGYFPSMEEEEDESGFRSGRTTPSMGSTTTYVSQTTGRRVQSQQAMPADRQAELRARAMTEDQFGPSMMQWRSQQAPVAPPPLPRLTSAMSAMSTSSEASFGNAPPRGVRQISQSRLGRSDEVDEESSEDQREVIMRYGAPRGMTRAPSHGVTPTVPYPHAPPLRNRSASTPNVYQVPRVMPAPPLPYSAANGSWASHGAVETFSPSSSSTLIGGTAYFAKRMSGGKRSSGESHSTETSETSSQQSPATPYGSVPLDPRGVTPVSRQNSQDAVPQGSTILIKVRSGVDQFIVGVPTEINYASLHHKVLKKLRVCSRSTNVGDALHIKWVDADNDEITIKCDADIEAMFGEIKDSGATCVNLIVR